MDAHRREDEIRTRLADVTGPEPGGPERALVGRLIRSFLAKTPVGVDQLAELLRGGTTGEVRDHAHGLKGSASNLGADTLAACFLVETDEAESVAEIGQRERALTVLGSGFNDVVKAHDAVGNREFGVNTKMDKTGI